MKKRGSVMDHVREMMALGDMGIPELPIEFRVPKAPQGPAPSQELIDCVVEVARIVFEAEAQMSWSRIKRGMVEEALWSSEETLLHNIALLVSIFSKMPRSSEHVCAIMDEASLAIDLTLAKHDGEIH